MSEIEKPMPARKQLFPSFSSPSPDEATSESSISSTPILPGPSPNAAPVAANPVKAEPKKNLMSIKEAQDKINDEQEYKHKKEDDDEATSNNLAQAEVEAMLDVEKRQEAAMLKSQRASVKAVTVGQKEGFDRDLHIDKSIIDQVKADSEADIQSIDLESKQQA